MIRYLFIHWSLYIVELLWCWINIREGSMQSFGLADSIEIVCVIPREVIGIGQMGNFCFCGSVSSEELPPDTIWDSVQIAKRTYSGSEMQPCWCRQQGAGRAVSP